MFSSAHGCNFSWSCPTSFLHTRWVLFLFLCKVWLWLSASVLSLFSCGVFGIWKCVYELWQSPTFFKIHFQYLSWYLLTTSDNDLVFKSKKPPNFPSESYSKTNFRIRIVSVLYSRIEAVLDIGSIAQRYLCNKEPKFQTFQSNILNVYFCFLCKIPLQAWKPFWIDIYFILCCHKFHKCFFKSFLFVYIFCWSIVASQNNLEMS
jgi:hypothetical protein